jgi:hypothetical protein
MVFRDQSLGTSLNYDRFCDGKWTAGAQELIQTGIMYLLADTLCVLRVNYGSQICLQLRGITEPVTLNDMEITPVTGRRTTKLTLAMSTNLLTNESYTDSCT